MAGRDTHGPGAGDWWRAPRALWPLLHCHACAWARAKLVSGTAVGAQEGVSLWYNFCQVAAAGCRPGAAAQRSRSRAAIAGRRLRARTRTHRARSQRERTWCATFEASAGSSQLGPVSWARDLDSIPPPLALPRLEHWHNLQKGIFVYINIYLELADVFDP